MFVTAIKSKRLFSTNSRPKNYNRPKLSLLICFWFILSTSNFFIICWTQMANKNFNLIKKGDGCSYKVWERNLLKKSFGIFGENFFGIFRKFFFGFFLEKISQNFLSKNFRNFSNFFFRFQMLKI